MVQLIEQLIFSHFVVAKVDGTIFASARDNDNKIHNFLITRYGDVKRQINNHFELLEADYAELVREQAQSYYSIRPIYRIPRLDFS